jgi:hypothetical protein
MNREAPALERVYPKRFEPSRNTERSDASHFAASIAQGQLVVRSVLVV